MNVSENIKVSYDNQYDASMTAWRTKAAKYKAKNIVELSKNIVFETVLEVGCGEGAILDWLSQWEFSNHLHAIEISESGIASTKSKQIKNLKSIQIFDGYQIPFPDNHFDLVICSHVMEHVEHERLLLREIKRVSKYQIFEVPIDFSFYVDKKINHFLSYGHINIYTPALFRFLLKTEKLNPIKDINYHYDNEILTHLYGQKKLTYYSIKIKQLIMKFIPYIGGIKPNSYAILTQKSAEDQLSIFK